MSTQTPPTPQTGRSGAPLRASRPPTPAGGRPKGSWQRGRWTLLLIAIICAAPIAISYFTYYVIKPKGGTTSYGTLIEPQRPIPAGLMVTGEDGRSVPLATLRGHWLMISVDGGACGEPCVTKLYFMRQVRATQAGERERIVNVWLRTDAQNVPAPVLGAYDDTDMLIADPSAVSAWLPVDAGTAVTDHIYMVDPNGNLMMRFPEHADPSKIRSDISKLLKWSSIG